MTAQLAAVAAPDPVAGDELAVLRGMLRPDFLARAGWDPVAQVLAPVRGDPLLSLRECAVAGCAASTAHRRADLCVTCRTRWKASELAWDDFLARPGGGRSRGDRPCRVTGCPRPGESDERLCATHTAQRQRHPGLSAESWLARPEVGPLPSFGACIVASCAAAAANRSGMCSAHSIAWCRHRRDHGGAVLAEWARHAPPADVAGHEIVLRGLPDRVVAELLAGLQRRTDAGLRTLPTSTRCLVKLLHARQAGSVLDLAQVPGAEIRPDARQLLRWLTSELYCLLSGPEKERAKDVWQLSVFGLPGKLDFTGISQRWLREAVKWWAAEDLPLRRGRSPADSARDTIRAAEVLSLSLRTVPRRRRAPPRRARPPGHRRVRQPARAPGAGRRDDRRFPAEADPPYLPALQRRARPGDDRHGRSRRRPSRLLCPAPQRHPQRPRPAAPAAQPARHGAESDR